MKTAIVTGAYGAIGKAIATGMAQNKIFHVIMCGRDEARLFQAVEEVKGKTGNNHISAGLVDLSLKQNIDDFAKSISRPVDVLINNASTTPRQREETADGTETQWAVNVLAYFRMINAFTPHLKAAGGARIVNVASYWAGDLDLNDPEFRHRRYNNNTAYRQSKQANRMLTRSFSELLLENNITVNACHPGDVNSKLSNNLGYGGSETPTQGADTPVWLASSKEVAGISGKYFEHRRQTTCHFMADGARVKALFDLCSKNY